MRPKPLSRIGKIFADGRRVDKALKLADQDAIRKHEQHNVPVVVWRNGGVAWVPARELLLKTPRKIASKTRPAKRPR
jgi:hypothetical protein